MEQVIAENFSNYIPPDWDSWFMKHAYLAAEKSKDPRTKIGSVIVKDHHIISTGYNGFPIGVNDSLERYENRETKYAMVVHSEDNAILSASRLGISVCGGTLYTQGMPCNECSKSVIQAGIKEIVIHKQWPTMIKKWTDSCKISEIMLSEANINIRILDKFLNILYCSLHLNI
jgi:dCMP deaminase